MLKQPRCSVFFNRSRFFRLPIIFLLLAVLLAVATSYAENDIYPLSPNQQHRTTSNIIAHHSFTPPLLQHYYGESEVPYWKFSGSTVITDSYIRLTTHNAGEIGHFWNREPVDMDAFEIVLGFNVFSSYKATRHFTDGFALWITTNKPERGGPILGHPMSFVGIGILFDDFDNDRKGDNPKILLLHNRNENERDRLYSPEQDFHGEYKGFCNFDYTKLSGSGFATARIRYNKGDLQVFLSGNDEKDEQLCFNLQNIKLSTPENPYYIGLTAQAGSIPCNHDIVFLHLSSLEGAHYDSDIYKPLNEAEELLLDQNSYVSQRNTRREPSPLPQKQQPSQTDTHDNSDNSDNERLKELERELEELRRVHRGL
ncbi:unnamed protein product [Phytomonas sp. Hart1]|nr:unnamed protein product [Phytomonas sp. Hart1]|eukprot:CCW66823.1 unnamed protein product [Phytomonas sp. isolate Hart1]